MNLRTLQLLFAVGVGCVLSGCSAAERVRANSAEEAPPAAKVELEADANVVKVEKPEQFPLEQVVSYTVSEELNATGQIMADVARTVPVISLASGRVVEVKARLGDFVKKGQLLLRVRSTDISIAFSDYRKSMADEALAKAQMERAQILYDKGAIAQKDLEIAQDVEAKAKVDLETTQERLRVLGVGTNDPSGFIDILAPIAGVITEQNITAAGGVKTLDNSPNLFTISDLSYVWVMCDVYENQMPFIRVGEYADVKTTAYPNMALHGRIDNIGSVLDPATRTAKVRLELKNPGNLRVGMFVNAIFHSNTKEQHTSVPATAVLHLHDRDWVYTPDAEHHFRRVEVAGGAMLAGKRQEIRSGLKAGEQVVRDALVLQNTVEQ